MLEAMMLGGFPRTDPLEVFTDEDGHVRATVPHHATHYVPDSLGADADEQYRAGPGSAGHPGLYELALSIMAFYLPSGFHAADEPVVLRSGRPNPQPLRVSRAAWDLHRRFAGEVLAGADPEHTEIPAADLYAWVARKRPDLEALFFEEPTDDPFEGLF